MFQFPHPWSLAIVIQFLKQGTRKVVICPRQAFLARNWTVAIQNYYKASSSQDFIKSEKKKEKILWWPSTGRLDAHLGKRLVPGLPRFLQEENTTRGNDLRTPKNNLLIQWNCNTMISSRLNIFVYLAGVSIALLTKENRNNCNKNSLVFSRTAKSSFIHLATFSLINHWNNLQFVMWKLISYRGFLKSPELLYNFLV